jgi:hypothetical protein
MTVPKDEQQEQNAISRREVLKAMAAVTGAAALAGLPSKWKKPVVQVGALPAHAQGTSPTGGVTITDASGECVNQFNQWDLYFDYVIPGGAVSFELSIVGLPSGCTGVLEGTPKLEKTGDAFSGSGKYSFIYKVKNEQGACTSVQATITVTDTSQRRFVDSDIIDPLFICEEPE